MTDARLRFQVAKGLAQLTPAARSFQECQQALSASLPVVASSVTRAYAARCAELLASNGLTAQLERPAPNLSTSSAPTRTSRGGAGAAVVVLLLALVLGAGGFWVWRSKAHHRLEAWASGAAAEGEAATRTGPDSDTLDEALASTVSIRCENSTGAGFLVTERHALTNAHVVCPEGEMMQVILGDGRRVLGTTRKRDDRLDLALVELSGATGTPLTFGDAATLKPGDAVAAIGSPRGMEFTVTRGSVSYVGRNRYGVGYLQIDINVNPGNSGGPILDGAGRVVGVMSMMVKDASGLALALPINYAFLGDAPMVEAPPELLHSEEWTELAERIADADAQEIAEAGESLDQPGLLGAALRPDGALIAIVFQRSEQQPAQSNLEFRVHEGDRDVCRSTNGHALQWRSVARAKERGLDDPQLIQWLERHKLDENIWVGTQEIFPRCDQPISPSSTTLTLLGASGRFARTTIVTAATALGMSEESDGSPESEKQLAEVARLEVEASRTYKAYKSCEERARNLGSEPARTCPAVAREMWQLDSDLRLARQRLQSMRRR